MNRSQIAVDVFNGNNEALYSRICEVNSYEQDGIIYAANGLTKLQVVEFVEALTDEEIEELEAVGLL